MRLVLAGLLVAASTHAQVTQLDLYRRVGTGLVPIKGTLDLGSSAPGDYIEVQLSLRNPGQQSVILTDPIYASGLGFTVENQALVGSVIAPAGIPGDNLDFRVRFAPRDPGSYTGVLNYLGKPQAELKGIAPEGVTVQVQRAAAFETLTTAATVDFGAVERKQTSVRQFALVNRTALSLTTRAVSVSGTGYAVEGVTPPIVLAPGATRTFAVRFAPLQSGILRGKLSIDGREFDLEGFALEPPAPTLSFEPQLAARSGVQFAVKIRLSEPSRAVGSVKLTLSGIETDAAVSLLPAGGRAASLVLKEGDTELSALIQTGTTAGSLKLAADLGAQHIEISLVLAPLVPSLASLAITRLNGRIELRLSGFDNTRGMREAGFLFYDRAGAPVSGVIQSAVTDAFAKYFAGSTLGGMFALSASFAVVGDIDSITAVEVELTNTQGAARSAKTAF